MTPARARLLLKISITSAIGTALSLGACDTTSSGAGANGSGSGAGANGSTGDLPRCYPATHPPDDTVCYDWPCETPGSAQCFPTQTTASSSSSASGGGGAGPCPQAKDVYFFVPTTCGVSNAELLADSPVGQCCYHREFACCSGRPLLLGGAPRTAGVRCDGEGEWTESRPVTANLDAATRAALSKAWLDDARMEHASVASFARFALELLAVGAPRELVEAAHAAAMDETDHARRCFTLASAYADVDLAPGPLELGDLRLSTDLAALTESAVVEGCVGETLAALLAVERLAGATDPAVRSTLEAIARDEARHAALAYRFVAWAIASGGEPIRRAACAAFDRALGDLVGPPVAAPTAARTALLQHGVASEADTRAAVRAAMDEVIVPAARQLGRGAGVEASTPAPRIDVALYLPRFKSAANETIVFCQ